MSQRHLYVLASLLTIVGLGLFSAKIWFFDLPVLPEKASDLWQVEARITFQGKGGAVKASIPTARGRGRLAIIDQSFVSSGYGLSASQDQETSRTVFSKRKVKGEQNLYYRFVIYDRRTRQNPKKQEKPPTETVPWTGSKLVAAQSLVENAMDRSADPATLVPILIGMLNAKPLGQEAAAVLAKKPTRADKVETMVGLLNLAGIPARSVHGLILPHSQTHSGLTHWPEAFVDGFWRPYSATTGLAGIHENYFTWWKGPSPFVQLDGGTGLKTRLTLSWGEESAIQSALLVDQPEARTLLSFSFLGLPMDVQQVYRVMVVVPLGVLFLVFLRNVIGISAFGTFMPVLIALSFRETQLLSGILLFTLIIGSSLVVRLYFEHLKLLVVPRLASILIVVILIMAGLSILTHKLDVGGGLSVALFPMVVLTMTVERMSILWDERGAAESLKHGVGSLTVASLCYLVMVQEEVEHLFFVFPELLLVTLALTLLLGRYNGYRLMELRRFRALTEKER